MRIGLWCAWWRPSVGLAAGGEISLFSLRVCGMKENLKAGCRMVKGGRKAESSSFSWRDAGILVFVVVFFFRPGDEIDNDNVLGYYTIPWRKPSLHRPLFKPFYIKWRHPNPAILSKKKFNNNNNTANTKATWGFPIFRTEKPSFFRAFSEKKKTQSHLTSMGELQLKIWH